MDNKQPAPDGAESAVQPVAGSSTSAVVTTTTPKFKPIGPKDLKKKYKFVEPPGITDWASAFAKKCALTMFIYGLGYFQLSTGWLVGPIILMVLQEQWRRSHDAQCEIAKAAARGDEREIVLARLGENLPSWVTFPDVERAEWLNQIIENEAVASSPLFLPFNNVIEFGFLRTLILIGEHDSPEFHRQSFAYLQQLRTQTPLANRTSFYSSASDEHFTIVQNLAQESSSVYQVMKAFLKPFISTA